MYKSNDFDISESEFLINRYLNRYYNGYELNWHIRESTFNDWMLENPKKNMFDYLIDKNLDIPNHELFFRLIPTLDKSNIKSFMNYIDFSLTKGLNIQYVSQSNSTYSKDLNFFEYSVHCNKSKLALYFYKHGVSPNIEQNGYSGITKVLEHGMFDILKLYKSLGLKKLSNSYGNYGLINYVGLYGTVIETLRTDENLNRSILRLDTLKNKFSDLLPENLSSYDIKILNQGIEYLESERNNLTTRDKKVSKFFYNYIENFTNGEYLSKPQFIKYGKNYLLKNDDRNIEKNITNEFWESFINHIKYPNNRTCGLMSDYSESSSKSPFSFLNKLDVPAPSNLVIRKMVSFVEDNSEHLKLFISYFKKIQKQGVNLQLPLVVDEKNPYACYNSKSLIEVAEENKSFELVNSLKEIGLTKNNSKKIKP